MGKSIFDRMSSLEITGSFVVPCAVMDHASSSSSSSRIHSQATNDDMHRFSMMKSSFKREYSKSLGTEGGLKPDQVLVPESYVVLDRNSRNQNGSDEEHQQPDGETKVKISTKNVFAVVSIGSHQHKVSPDDLFFVEKLRGANVNDVVELPRVLMVGSKTKTIVGRPVVENARVTCLVEEVLRDEKTIIFKKRRRKYSRRWNGARQTMTGLRVLDVEGIDE